MSPPRFRPYPAYKDSGVEWLGEIPVHWISLALSRVTLSRCDGPFGSGLKSEHYFGDGVRVIRLQNIGSTAFLDTDRAFIAEDHAKELGDHSVIAGDLLIAGLGDEGLRSGGLVSRRKGLIRRWSRPTVFASGLIIDEFSRPSPHTNCPRPP